MNAARARCTLTRGISLALLSLASRAAAEDVQDERVEERVPAAWASPATAKPTGLVDVRSFYQYVDGKGVRRPDWTGSELLGYVNILDGLSGAFILRHEVRDSVAYYGTTMLMPRIGEREYLVTSFSVGNGADFVPITRLDVQLRGFFGKTSIMYDVGGYSTWWTSNRQQSAESAALIFWQGRWIVEARETVLLMDPGFGKWRPNYRGNAVVLYGAEKERWLVMRLSLGNEPENAPGIAFADTRDLFAAAVAVSYRKWLTPDYGLSGEVELFHQWGTWSRLGFTGSVFASF